MTENRTGKAAWIGVLALVQFFCLNAAARPPALQDLAENLSGQLSKVLSAELSVPPLVAIVVEGDQAIIGQEGRIAQELERLLVFHLEEGTAVERVFPLGAGSKVETYQRAQLAGASWLIRCVVGIKKNRIHLSADLSPARASFWDRLVEPVPRGVKHHLFASAKIDEEIGLLLGKARTPPALGSWHLDELIYLPGRIIDLGIGDLDGQAGAELVLLFESAIQVYSLTDAGPKRLARYELKQIPRARIQTRDPSGSLLVSDFNGDGRSEVFYKLFNYRWGEVLSLSGSGLRPVRRLSKIPICQFRRGKRPMVLYGDPDPGTNRYSGKIELVDINASQGKAYSLSNQFSTLRCWQVEPGKVWAIAVDDNGDMVRLAADWTAETLLSGVGAGAGILDLDQDGRPELVLSKPVWPGEQDGVRVVSAGEVVWRSGDVVGSLVAVAGGTLKPEGKVQAVLAAVEANGRASRVYVLGR